MVQIAICTSGGWNTGVHAICKLEIQLFRKKALLKRAEMELPESR